MSKLVCLDLGHGGNDSGAVKGSRYESNDVLKLGLRVKEHLKRNGVDVFCTRESNITVSLTERTKLANSRKADVLVSIHRNAFNCKAYGLETFVYNGYRYKNAGKLAENIQSGILSVASFHNRGVKEKNLHMVRESNMVACLTEVGFVDNDEDNNIFDSKFENIAVAIAKGILAYLGISYVGEVVNVVPPAIDSNRKVYRVVCGFFTDRANANAQMDKLKAKGIDGFLVAHIDSAGRKGFRVICGSYVEKNNADKRCKEIKDKAGLDTFFELTNV